MTRPGAFFDHDEPGLLAEPAPVEAPERERKATVRELAAPVTTERPRGKTEVRTIRKGNRP